MTSGARHRQLVYQTAEPATTRWQFPAAVCR